MEIVDIKYRGNGYEYQDYSDRDNNLVSSNYIFSSFGKREDYIEYHTYNEEGFLIDTNYDASNYYPENVKAANGLFANIELDPQEDLRIRGFDRGTLTIQYNFFRRLFNSNRFAKYWIKEISTSRTELKLSSQDLSDSSIRSGFTNYQIYIQEKNYYPDFYLNFGDNRLVICTNVAYTEDEEGSYLLIKLYEPLPLEFGLKSDFWIVDKIAESASYLVNIQIESTPVVPANRLRGANFKISLDKKIGQTTPYYNYSTLFSSTFFGGNDKLKSYYDDKAVDINIDFSEYSNFIHFSSVSQRLNNFKYKLQLIEDYNAQIAFQQTAAGSATDATINTLQSYIDQTIEKFDIYEYALYYNSASWAWPKTTSTQPYLLSPTTALDSVNWFATQSLSASYYDNINPNQLSYTIPQYILDDSNNQPYVTFVQMVGQHFDNVWVYYKDVTNRFDATNDLETGISGDLVSDALRGLGFITYTNTSISDNLYYSLFGINEDGSLLPPIGNELIDNYVLSDMPTIGANDLQKEIYKRLYHNLPYLVKTKGTRVGITALTNCFGIPEEILTINEFGGYNRYSKNGISEVNNDKITIIPQPLQLSSSLLHPNASIQYFSTDNRLNTSELEFGFSPSDKINANINQTQGYFNIDSLIGNPLDMYNPTYTSLDSFRNAYFSSYTFPHSLYEYMRMIKYYNNAIFKTVKDFVPARADLSTGLIIKPSMLDRSKYARHEPSASLNLLSQSIDMIEITGGVGNTISGSTQHSWDIPSQLGYIQYTSSQGVEKVTGEFGGTIIDVVNGLSMSQYDISSYTGSLPVLVNRGATFQNISKAVKSHWRLDLDYSANQTTPVNYGLITASIAQMSINYSASYGNKYNPFAELQDYNYYTKAWSNFRYDGSYTKSKFYSTYSVGDISYGKQAAIDKLKFQYAYLVDIYTASAFFPARSNAQIKYIIDDNQDVINLTKTNENIFEVQNIFKSGETTDVSLFEYDERNSYSQKLLSKKPISIYEGGFRYVPILHSISGSFTPYSQSFELQEPIVETIYISQGSTSPLPVNSGGPEFLVSNYELNYFVNETDFGDGNSRYTISLSARYLPTGGPGATMILNVVTHLQSDGLCNPGLPITDTIAIPTGISTKEYGTKIIVDTILPSTGNGTGNSDPWSAPNHWPPYSSVNRNCEILIRSITVQVAPSPGGGTMVPFETSNMFFSSSNTCLFYLTASNQIMFDASMSNQVHIGNEPIYLSESDPFWLGSGLDRVVQPFSLAKGDRVSFYNVRSLGWDQSNEYVVDNVTTTGSAPNIRILASLDRPVNQYLVSSSLDIDTMTNSNLKICRYVVWKHLPDETNVILKYNPKDSTLIENGLLFPQYIDPVVRKNSGNTVKALKAQNLI